MRRTIATLPLAVIAVMLLMACGKSGYTYQKSVGTVFGTSYSIIYEYDNNLDEDIKKTLQDVDNSLSPFNKSSVITAINENKDPEIDDMMMEVYNLATQISKDTNGAFDITVAPLVNAWGFGFKSGKMPNDQQIDSIRSFVGYTKTSLDGRHIRKTDPRIMLDCSAIAKGYGVDKVAEMLKSKGIENFMVEIGGEIVTLGVNSKSKDWQIGVTKPSEDSLSVNEELQTILSVSNTAMATSGNYRNFYYKDGKRYAHTIDPMTGKPVQHNILSATVLAEKCATADAYATSFMVMGLDRAKEVLSRHKELKAYLIYCDANGNYATWQSEGLQ